MKINECVQDKSFNDNVIRTSNYKDLTWMDSTEASSYLRVSIGSLRNMVNLGQIKSYKLGRRLRFKKVELDEAVTLSN